MKGKNNEADENQAVVIADVDELKSAFTKLIDCKGQIAQADEERKAKQAEIDRRFDDVTGDARNIVVATEPAVKDFCIEHREDLLPKGKQSAIIGPATIQFRKGNKVVVHSSGEKADEASIIAALEHNAGLPEFKAVRELLLNCVDTKKVVKQGTLKELPDDVLKRMGLKIAQDEKFSWEPNGER